MNEKHIAMAKSIGIIYFANNSTDDTCIFKFYRDELETYTNLVIADAVKDKDERIANLEAYAKHERSLASEPLMVEITDLKQQITRLEEICDALLNHCDKENGECSVCATIVCPHKEPFHFHHDGCPACAQDKAKQALGE
jgi:hypothetical protein